MNKILLLLLLVSITQSESVEQGIGIAAETNPTAQPLVLTDVLTDSVARPRHNWTKEEDARLLEAVNKYGSKWAMIAIMIPGKTRKQCRQRWTTVVMPGINKAPWTTEEDEILLSLYEEMGPRWSLISPRIPGRTGNQCWNRCNLLKKSLNKKAELNKQITDAEVKANPTVPIVKRKCRCPWTKEENARLTELVNKYGTGDWDMIASLMEGRTDQQCRRKFVALNKKAPLTKQITDAEVNANISQQLQQSLNFLATTAEVPKDVLAWLRE